jgi:glutathione S-transferase
MQLIGMLDSPYVRRVAISMHLLGVDFEHRSISVFRTFEQFRAINPVVKAPSLVCDDGEVLMDSSLILELAEAMAGPGRSLMPSALPERQHALRLVGLALAACEKTVQIVYEHELRPAEKQHRPWLDRVGGQLAAAYGALEDELRRRPLPAERLTQAGISAAVAWSFTQLMLPDAVSGAAHPTLQAFAADAERHPAFLAFPQR